VKGNLVQAGDRAIQFRGCGWRQTGSASPGCRGFGQVAPIPGGSGSYPDGGVPRVFLASGYTTLKPKLVPSSRLRFTLRLHA